MSKEYSILKNTSFLMAGTLVQRFLSFFTAIMVTRYLGPERYGQFTFIIAFVTIVAVVWDFGLNTLLVREVSQDKSIAPKYSGNIIVLKTILLILIFPGMLAYLKFLGYNITIIKAVVLFALGTFITSLTGIFESIFTACKRMDYSAVLNALRAILLLGLVIIVVNITGGVLEIVLCYFISFVGVFFISLYFLKKTFTLPSFEGISISGQFKLIKASLPYLMTSVVSIILFKIDHVMLSKMSGDVELGLYGAAYTPFEIIISFFPMMIMRSSFPVMCEKYSKDFSGMLDLYKKLYKIFLLLGLPISMGTIILSNELILVLFGKDYIAAGPLMLVLGAATWVFFLTNLMAWTLVAINRQVLVLISGTIAMISNIIINLFVIPVMGALGSAIATLICEMWGLLFMTIVIRKKLNIKFENEYFKIIICTAVMSLSIFLIKQVLFVNDILKLVIIIPSGVIIYFLMASLFKVYKYEDMKHILK
jgi:O-antigen/teichoic acid export membrane protein